MQERTGLERELRLLRSEHEGPPPMKSKTSSSARSSLHNVPTSHVFMHVYFPKLSFNPVRTDQDFFDSIVGQTSAASQTQPSRFALAGIDIFLVNNSNTMVSDFKNSLQTPGVVIVYLGHTLLTKTTTLGLTPVPGAKRPAVSCAELGRLLRRAKAKIVILAGCATDACVRRVKGETVVIVTKSGKDRLTNSIQWWHALKAFVDELVDSSGTAGTALAAANKVFNKMSSTDSFVAINGDMTLKL